MVDEPIAPIAPAAEAAPVAPAVEPTAPAAVVEAPLAAPVAETPVAPVEAAKTEAPAVEAPKVENVLGETKTEAKPDVKTETKTETPVETKIELPTYEPFKLPENVTLEKEPMDAFGKILGKIETGKLDHAGMQSAGQELIDLAAKSTVDSINRYTDSLVKFHEGNIKARFDALKADPDLGGDKLPETISALQKSVTEFGGTEAQVAEFRKEITEAGLGASPAICRLIYNMQQKINKYTTEASNMQVPAVKPAPTKLKPYQSFYTG